MRVRIVSVLAAALAAGVLSGNSLLASRAESPDGARRQVTVAVTVVPKHRAGIALTSDDVLVYQNRKRRPVVGWKPMGNATPLDLAILVDDSLRSKVSLQWSDVRQFVQSLPPSARVALYYAQHGDATAVQKFTSRRSSVLKALRVPVGRPNEISSIFQSVTDLVKHWPHDGNRRAMLVVSDGIDLFYGMADSLPTLNPSLDPAIQSAQRGGVTVYAIYANTADSFGRNLFLVTNGQGSLNRLAQETGGEAFFEGLQTPVDFAPFLGQVAQRLGQQYLLTFEAASGRTGYQPLQVKTEQPNFDLLAPRQIFVPRS